MIGTEILLKIRRITMAEFNCRYRAGQPFMGSMNVADLHYSRGTVEWSIMERMYYYQMQEAGNAMTDDGGIILAILEC